MTSLNSSRLDSYGKFKLEQQKKFKNNVWTSFTIINKIKNYILLNNLSNSFKTALDPCAGSGRLIQSFPEYQWQGFENDKIIYDEYDLKKLNIYFNDFFNVELSPGSSKFNLTICNPPYCNNGGINKWIKKISSLSSKLFLIVPVNYINKFKDFKPYDVISCQGDEMDESYNALTCVYVFDFDNPELFAKQLPALFWLNSETSEASTVKLKDYLEYVETFSSKKEKLDDIPSVKSSEPGACPVYTVANKPVKYTNIINYNGEAIAMTRQYLTHMMPLRYINGPSFLNTSYYLYKFKNDEAKKFILKNLIIINDQLNKIYKNNNIKTPLNPFEVLEIPIPFDSETSDIYAQFNAYLKKWKYYNLLTPEMLEDVKKVLKC